MQLTTIAVRYPVLIIIAAVLIALWGLSYFNTMSRCEDPEIVIRGARIITYFPGALPEDIEQYVSKPLEDIAAELAEVDEIGSTSMHSVSIVMVMLDPDIPVGDIAQVWDRLRAKIDGMRDTLPQGTSEPVVDDEFFDTNSHLICISGADYTPRELAAFADRIKRRLSALPAAGKVDVWGEQAERIYLEFDQLQLTRYGVTLEMVLNAIQGTNLLFPGGEIEAGQQRYSIDATGEFRSLADIANLPVYGAPGAQQVRLDDLGELRYGYEDPPQFLARVNGAPCVIVSIVMKSGKNVMVLGEQVERELAGIRASLPDDVAITIIQDQPSQVATRVNTFIRNLLTGIVLVILVVLLFMGVRPSIPVGLAIPLVLISSFAVFSLMGTTLQQMSIAGLIIALGMLVDNAIVVTDNVSRYLDQGIERRQAAIKATRELSLPMLTSTLTTVCAFIPLLMLPGETGDFIRDIPLTVSVAILLSYVIALTVTPMLCSLVVKPASQSRSIQPLAPLMRLLERGYPPLLHWTQRNILATSLIVFVAFVASLWLFGQLGVQFFPGAERNQFVIDLNLPEGSSVRATAEIAGLVEDVICEQDGIQSYATYAGQGGPRFYYNRIPVSIASHYAELVINTDSPVATDRLVPLVRGALAARVPGARIEVKKLEQGPPVGAPIQIKIAGDSLVELRRIGGEVQAILAGIDGVIDVHDSFGKDSRQLKLQVDNTQLRAIGLTTGDINKITALLTSGLTVTEYRAPNRSIPVVMRVIASQRDEAADLNSIYLHNMFTGDPVPLSSIASFETLNVTSKIHRTDRMRDMVVSANMSGDLLASDAMAEALPNLEAIKLPPGYSLRVSGEAEESGEAFGNLGIAVTISALLIVLILVAQFKSIRIGLVVFLAIPLSLIGAVLGLYISGWPFGFTAGLGVVSLVGIVINNSIVLMDFIMVKLKAGLPLDEAISTAGRERLRPIILTTATTIGGLLPLGLFGGSMWAPMAFAIIGGLIVSTFLTLIVVPLIFRLVAARRAIQLVESDLAERLKANTN